MSNVIEKFRKLPNGKWTPIIESSGVAMDAAPNNVDADFSPEVKAKIARAKRKVALDKEADETVKALFPFLQIAVAMDDKDAEQAAMGTFSSEEESEAEDEAPESFEATIIASAKASRQHWQDIHRRNAERRKALTTRKPAGKAVDAQQRNARAARQYSAFTSSARLCKGFHK